MWVYCLLQVKINQIALRPALGSLMLTGQMTFLTENLLQAIFFFNAEGAA